jgi:4-amino-4-deoxy-L-arabinose transferase-like glycosyltransferase
MKSILPKEIDYRFWRIMGLIMVIGTVLRLTGYNFALPYIDTRDEATYLVGSLTLRGLYDQPLRLLGYPPGIYGVYSIAQLVIEAVTHASALIRPADIVQIVRLADIFIGLVTIPIIGLIARWLKGNYAGLIAAAAWAVIPIVVSQSSIAMPDAWLLFFSALSIYWALVGIEANWPGWLLLSILAGLGAVVFKYSTFPVLGPAVFIALWRLRSSKNPWLYVVLGQVFCIIGCAVILFGVFHAANLTTVGSEATTFTNSGASRAINIPLGTSLISLTISQAGIIPFVAVALLFISVPFYFQQASTKQKLGWLLIAGFTFTSAWLTATYIDIAVEFGGYYTVIASQKKCTPRPAAPREL